MHACIQKCSILEIKNVHSKKETHTRFVGIQCTWTAMLFRWVFLCRSLLVLALTLLSMFLGFSSFLLLLSRILPLSEGKVLQSVKKKLSLISICIGFEAGELQTSFVTSLTFLVPKPKFSIWCGKVRFPNVPPPVYSCIQCFFLRLLTFSFTKCNILCLSVISVADLFFVFQFVYHVGGGVFPTPSSIFNLSVACSKLLERHVFFFSW